MPEDLHDLLHEEGDGILTESEYAAIVKAMANAGITDLEEIEKVCYRFEKARINIVLLEMLELGLTTVLKLNTDGEPVFGQPNPDGDDEIKFTPPPKPKRN